MREGWRCPVCNRGVSPDEKACDHGNAFATGIPIGWKGPSTGYRWSDADGWVSA